MWRFISTQSTGPESDASIVSKSLQLLNNSTQIQCIIQQMNSVQNTAVTKLNILYSLAFTYSRSHMNHIIEKNKILNANQPIPADIIVSQFDRYFHSNLDSFYSELTDSGNDNFLPTETIGDE